MPKDAQFKVFDLRRKNPQMLPSPPIKIRDHRLDVGEWSQGQEDVPAGRLRSGRVWKPTRGRVAKKKAAPKPPKRPSDILKALDPGEFRCMHCDNWGDNKECGIKCYRSIKKQSVANQIDIRGPGRLGYAAFTKPRVRFVKDQYLDEYIGDLRPLDVETESLYCFVGPRCVVDAERAGNWTRFINSSCRPNVSCEATMIGKRNVIVFKALKDIGPEEELTFNYGPNYFKNAGFDCACNARKGPHKAVKER